MDTTTLWPRLQLVVAGPWRVPGVGPADCWPFTGRWRSRYGYGRLRERGHGGRQLQAHVALYLILRGPYPRGLVLDHTCRTPACCNPWHLEPVPVAVNNRRKGPRPAPVVPLGEVERYMDQASENWTACG